MKIELKQIINELTKALGLPFYERVGAIIDDNDNIVGWTICNISEKDNKIIPIPGESFRTIGEMFDKKCSYYLRDNGSNENIDLNERLTRIVKDDNELFFRYMRPKDSIEFCVKTKNGNGLQAILANDFEDAENKISEFINNYKQ